MNINIDIIRSILKERKEDSHKGTYGHLLVTAGSYGYRGAAILATLGAYYVGTGLVSVASTEETISAVVARVPEAIFINTANLTVYLKTLSSVNACLIGCGLSKSSSAKTLLEETIVNANCPLVIDADGLNLLSQNQELLKKLKGEVILTPHIGEFSRLASLSIDTILLRKEELALEYAKKNNVIVILKSDKTIIATPDGETYRNTVGNSGLAKAGSGDLLAGIVAGLLAMGYSSKEAAISGVYLHSLAADIASKTRNRHTLTASYIAEYISDAYNMIFYR